MEAIEGAIDLYLAKYNRIVVARREKHRATRQKPASLTRGHKGKRGRLAGA